jgi:hypothetical protein
VGIKLVGVVVVADTATGPGVAGFCGVVYPLLDAVELLDDVDEEADEEIDESEDSDIGLSWLRSSPFVLAALDPGLLLEAVLF